MLTERVGNEEILRRMETKSAHSKNQKETAVICRTHNEEEERIGEYDTHVTHRRQNREWIDAGHRPAELDDEKIATRDRKP